MTKKIGELTLNEVRKICQKQKKCEECPLVIKPQNFACLCISADFCSNEAKKLNQEIEVNNEN